MRGKETHDSKAFRATHLHPGEEVRAFAEGWTGSAMGTGERKQYNGTLIITNRRAVFICEGVFQKCFKAIDIDSSTCVELTQSMFKKQLHIRSHAGSISFKSFEPASVIECARSALISSGADEPARRAEDVSTHMSSEQARPVGRAVDENAKKLSPWMVLLPILALVVLSMVAVATMSTPNVAGADPAAIAQRQATAERDRVHALVRTCPATIARANELVRHLAGSMHDQQYEEAQTLARSGLGDLGPCVAVSANDPAYQSASDALATVVRDSAEAQPRQEFERTIDDIMARALQLSRAGRYLEADAIYQEASATTSKIRIDQLSKPGVIGLLGSRRAAIAGEVAAEQRARTVSEIMDRVVRDDRASYQRAESELQHEADLCGRCKSASQIAKASREIERIQREWPVDLQSIKEMRMRYADLLGRQVRVEGTLSASTYYNCNFRASQRWRSFALTDDRSSMHVYCDRQLDGCDQVFDQLASGNRQTGTATLAYPESNTVCADGQSELYYWSPDAGGGIAHP
jgi:hypothetical protein